MRPTSIIFLCLSVLLIVGGIVTCYVAAGMATDEGIELFETSGGVSDIEEIPLEDKSLNKISLILKDADVNIYGGAEKPYIELIGYTGQYSYGVSSGILTIDESIGFLKLLDFGESNIKFGGLRQYIFSKRTELVRKAVNIYLPDLYQLKQLEVKLDHGDIAVSNLKIRHDLIFKIGSGNLLFENNKINAAVSIDIGTGNTVFRKTDLVKIDAAIKHGDLSYYALNYAHQTYEIAVDDGEIFIEGESKGDTYTASTPMAYMKVTIAIKDGNVYLGKEDPNAPKPEPEETTGSGTAAEETGTTT